MIKKKNIRLKLTYFTILAALIIFPLGKLAKLRFVIGNFVFAPNALDFLVLFAPVLYYINKFKMPKISGHFTNFFIVCLFSLIISLGFFTPLEVLFNSMYLVRLVSYFFFFVVIWNLVQKNVITKTFLIKALIFVSLFIAILGWVQYTWLPDLTNLKFWGWDDHLYRLVSTFLDPTFTSIFLVFGTLLSAIYYWEVKQKAYLVISVFLALSLLFTYTRAAYLGLFFGFLSLFYMRGKKNISILVLSLAVFGLGVLALPKKSSEGTILTRTQSIVAKMDNYVQTIQIIKKYPVFGVGFNNMCAARLRIMGGDPFSHACTGSDSSLLFVFATTGIIGFIIFLNLVWKLLNGITSDVYAQMFITCAFALFIHSLFVQSAFYSHVMGYMGILYATAIKKS